MVSINGLRRVKCKKCTLNDYTAEIFFGVSANLYVGPVKSRFFRCVFAALAMQSAACVEGTELDSGVPRDGRWTDAARDTFLPRSDGAGDVFTPTDRVDVADVVREAATDVPSPPPDIPMMMVCGLRSRPCCMDGSCEPGTACVMGTCTGCGMRAQPCCAGSSCTAGSCVMGTCVDPMMLCGNATQPCCDGSRCIAPATCESGVCRAGAICGQLGQSCCMGTTCNAGLRCTTGICRMICGGNGEPCCGAGACNAGYTCMAGLCSNAGMMGGCGARAQACCAGRVCNAGLVCGAGGVCQ
jgi:hypothetical protein